MFTALPHGYRWATPEEVERRAFGDVLVKRDYDSSGHPYLRNEADIAVPMTSETRTVYVVSWHGHSSGGFDWYFNVEDGTTAFEKEVGPDNGWGSTPLRVRLVAIDVPKSMTNEEATSLLDIHIDLLESEAPALRDLSLNGYKEGDE